MLKKTVMTLWIFKVSIVYFILLLLSFGCTSSDKNNHVLYGNSCKIWLIFDSGPTPFLLCINDSIYEDYRILNNGILKKRDRDPSIEKAYRGGKWRILDDSLYLNDFAINKKCVNSDTIFVRKDSYLINVTDKLNIPEILTPFTGSC